MSMPLPMPKNRDRDFDAVANQSTHHNLRSRMSIVKLDDAIITYSGLGVRNLKLIPQTFFENAPPRMRRYYYAYALFKSFMQRRFKIERDDLLVLHNLWSGGYHHWITEVLPKIQLVDPVKFAVLIPEDYPHFAFESLRHFLFKEIVKIPKGHSVLARQITLISNPNSGEYDPSQIQYLRDALISKVESDKSTGAPESMIYVSRSKERLRRVENEDDVIGVMKSYKFRILNTAELSFSDQISIFSRCSVFASIHGAALTNMIWMPKGASVLEFYRELKSSGDTMNACYWKLAGASGINYYYQFCRTGFNAGSHIDKVNLIVDIDKLKRNLDLVCR